VHGAQQVRAERDLDSGAVRELQRVQPLVQDVEDFGVTGLGLAVAATVLCQRRLRHQGWDATRSRKSGGMLECIRLPCSIVRTTQRKPHSIARDVYA
jgi:hypothetical protein